MPSIDSSQETRSRGGLPPRAPSKSDLLSRANGRLAAAVSGGLAGKDALTHDAPPLPLGLVSNWSLTAPKPKPYQRPMSDGVRMARGCSLVHIGRIADLVSRVPALREQRPGTYVAFDLDDTLVHKDLAGVEGLAEPGSTLEALADLQSRHTCVGLTARPYDSGYRTHFQLHALGLHFRGAPGRAGAHDSISNAGNVGGVYFAGPGTSKGDLLLTLRRDHPDLKHLVFVDDQPCNFFSMIDAVVRAPDALQLTCVRYSHWRNGNEAREDWQALAYVFCSRDVEILRGLDAEDRGWRIGHAIASDSDAHAVTTLLAHYLKRPRLTPHQRLQCFIESVRDDALLLEPKLAPLEAAVRSAQKTDVSL